MATIDATVPTGLRTTKGPSGLTNPSFGTRQQTFPPEKIPIVGPGNHISFPKPSVPPSPSPDPAKSNNNGFFYYSQPFGGQEGSYTQGQPNFGKTPPNVAPVAVAEQRTGFTQEQAPSLGNVSTQFQTPNYQNITGPSFQSNPGTAALSPIFNQAVQQKQALGLSDFGIPASVIEQMKTQENAGINQQKTLQQQASARLLHNMGLSNDSANYKANQDIESQAAQAAAASNNNIDIQSGLQANQQRLQNLNDLVGAGQAATQVGEQGRQFNANLGQQQNALGEQGRQFNVGAATTSANINNAIQQWLEQARVNRSNVNESVANFLENLELQKAQASAGLVAQAPQIAGERLNTINSILGSTPNTGGGSGGGLASFFNTGGT